MVKKHKSEEPTNKRKRVEEEESEEVSEEEAAEQEAHVDEEEEADDSDEGDVDSESEESEDAAADDDEEEEEEAEDAADESTAAAKADDAAKRTVFVSGIAYETTEEQLKTFFKSCGTIKEVRLPRYRDTQRCLGYGHVEFQEEAAANKAVLQDGQSLSGRYLDISIAREKGAKQISSKKQRPPAGCKTVFVKNLPYDIEEDVVGDAFAWCGKVSRVRLVTDSRTQRFKGFGYVDFEAEAALSKAIEMDGRQVKGRRIQVDFDVGRPKGSFRERAEASKSKYVEPVKPKVSKDQKGGKPDTKRQKRQLF
eukprot:GILJ01006301.1.p1 GENE.GILJ01006301.1~~GILJ01006301.1.p1  ORF type:complete len:319 (-),score=67.70 GILJ01006301.1:156-1082(-)